MKRAVTIVGLLGIMALASSSTQGTPYTGGVCIDNLNNTSTDPHATTSGLVWINTGSGPALLNQDINMELLCGGTQAGLAPC